MSEKTVTLKLQGVVTVAAFCKALQSFTALIRELSTDAKARGMAWDVTGLEAGSAQVTACADLADRFTEQQADLVAEAYLDIGRKLAQRESLLGYRVRVRKPALALAGTIGADIDSVMFETPDGDALVTSEPTAETPYVEGDLLAFPTATLGAVTGRVQSLSSRGGLRFTIFDSMDDKAVSCYLDRDSEPLMIDVWGKLATVEGVVSRDPRTGRALAVRRISGVVAHDECQPDDYRVAKASVIPLPGAAKPEDIIRRMRDAN